MAHAATAQDGHHFAHHFKNADHEFVTCKQGMWLFLLQEILFFSPLFVAYALFRGLYPETWAAASTYLDWKMGALNTVILLTSSWTMVRAVTAAQTGQQGKLSGYLILTMLCAVGFMVVKYFEYSHKIHLGLLPAGLYTNPELVIEKAPVYFSLYFIMTGLHGIHVLAGLFVMFWIWLRARRKEFGPGYYTPVEMTGLYWHFVDLVWIYLFPLLYLV